MVKSSGVSVNRDAILDLLKEHPDTMMSPEEISAIYFGTSKVSAYDVKRVSQALGDGIRKGGREWRKVDRERQGRTFHYQFDTNKGRSPKPRPEPEYQPTPVVAHTSNGNSAAKHLHAHLVDMPGNTNLYLTEDGKLGRWIEVGQ